MRSKPTKFDRNISSLLGSSGTGASFEHINSETIVINFFEIVLDRETCLNFREINSIVELVNELFE